MNEWKEVTIEEIKANSKGSIAIGPFGSRLKSDNYIPSGIPVIRGTNISSSKEFSGNFVYISKEKALSLGSANVYPNDLVFPHRGAIGEVGLVNGIGNSHYVLSSSLMKLTLDLKKADPNFLFYFFKSNTGRHELLKNASTVGTPGIGQPLSSLKSIRLNLPPLPEQKSIAHILGKLDDKIALNRQMNQTLEAMAQALFKSWFVDFDPVMDNALAGQAVALPDVLKTKYEKRKAVPTDKKLISTNPELAALFPSSFVFNETLGKWIPDGWEVNEINSLCKKIQNGGTPRRDNEDYWKNGDIPWLASGEVRQNIICRTNSFISEIGLGNSSAKWVRKYSTVIAMYGATAGQVAIIARELTTNQAVCSLIPKSGYEFFNYLNLSNQVSHLENQARGSAQQNISKGIIELLRVVVPNSIILKHFHETMKVNFEKHIDNIYQTETLTQLRDRLLPELISGRVRVREDLLGN